MNNYENYIDRLFTSCETSNKSIYKNFNTLNRFIKDINNYYFNSQKEKFINQKNIFEEYNKRKETSDIKSRCDIDTYLRIINCEELIKELKKEFEFIEFKQKLKQLLTESLGEIKRMQIFYQQLKDIIVSQPPTSLSDITDKSNLWYELSVFLSCELNWECKAITPMEDSYAFYSKQCYNNLFLLNPRDCYTIYEIIGIKFPHDINNDISFSIAHNEKEIRLLIDQMLQYSLLENKNQNSKKVNENKPSYIRKLGPPSITLLSYLTPLSSNYLSILKHNIIPSNHMICSPKIYVCLEETISLLYKDFKEFYSLNVILSEVYNIKPINEIHNFTGQKIRYNSLHRDRKSYENIKNPLLSKDVLSYLLCFEDIIEIDYEDKTYHLVPALIAHLLIHPLMSTILPKADKNDGLSLLQYYSSFLYHPSDKEFSFYLLSSETESPSLNPSLNIIPIQGVSELFITFIIRPKEKTELYNLLSPYSLYNLINDIEKVDDGSDYKQFYYAVKKPELEDKYINYYIK